jgi:hypothetical protein
VRIARRGLGAQSCCRHHFQYAPFAFRAFQLRLVNLQRLAHNRAHAHPRIERRERILENHLHLRPQTPQRPTVRREQILPTEAKLTRIRLDQPQQHSR